VALLPQVNRVFVQLLPPVSREGTESCTVQLAHGLSFPVAAAGPHPMPQPLRRRAAALLAGAAWFGAPWLTTEMANEDGNEEPPCLSIRRVPPDPPGTGSCGARRQRARQPLVPGWVLVPLGWVLYSVGSMTARFPRSLCHSPRLLEECWSPMLWWPPAPQMPGQPSTTPRGERRAPQLMLHGYGWTPPRLHGP
jgi:hypothetical protein